VKREAAAAGDAGGPEPRAGPEREEAPSPRGPGASLRESPTVALLSHRGSPAVPSPKRGLTSVFGMGTGVAPAL
jgi:hypothetical protein